MEIDPYSAPTVTECFNKHLKSLYLNEYPCYDHKKNVNFV